MRILALLAVTALVAACAAESGEEDLGADDQALTARAVDGPRAIAPEGRVLAASVPVLLGAQLEAGARVLAIRTLTLDGKKARLVVDADSLVSAVVEEGALAAGSRAPSSSDRLDEAPYPKSLASLRSSLDALDSIAPGARTPDGATEPFALTIDMCQSKKAFEKRLFDWAESLSDQVGRAVPVGIAMSGGWAKAHGSEFDQILGYERRGKIAITWINHSSSHPLHCLNASCSDAQFLTAPGVDFGEEVLGLERALLARGQVPSPIFRFPGLVHNDARMKELAGFSLMAIDGDAWIAKGQPIKPRAVVLVHGNGNEPEGITGFLKQAGTRSSALASGRSALVDPLLIAPSPAR